MSSAGQPHATVHQELLQAETGETLLISDAVVAQETAELLQDVFHPSSEDAATGSARRSEDTTPNKKGSSTVKRLLMLLPILTFPTAITLAPRIEIYNILACSVHKPELLEFSHGTTSTQFTPELPIISGFYSVDYNANIAQTFNTQLDNGNNSVVHLVTNAPGENKCASDPVVRAAVARLTAVISVTTGVLNCLTTGWWGAFSDRHGRKFVIILAASSMLVTDLTYIFATWFLKHIPGGYWFLLIGAVGDGLFGGLNVATLTNQSYISDKTDEHSRAAVFSLALGLLFCGLAVGPTIGSLLIHFTGRILSVFYLGAALHIIYALSVFFFVPESLSDEKMKESRVKYAESKLERLAGIDSDNKLYSFFYAKAQGLLVFLNPLALFLPVRHGVKRRLDWSMTTMAVGYALLVAVGGSYTYKFQYAASTFNWSSETLGYWLSAVGATRAVHLALVLPVIIKIFKPKSTNSEHSTTSEPDVRRTDAADSETSPLLRKSDKAEESHSSAFDIKIAKFSLIIEVLAFLGMGLAKHTPLFFASGVLGSFSSGFGPAAEATILALYLHRGGTETGKLFGAVGLVQAICSQVVGPTVFGFIYMKTVGTYPRTIFVFSTSSVVLSLILITVVRLPKRGGHSASVDDQRDGTSEA